MPSGSKKRKAAKKKMESVAHTKPPGIDEAKTQDSDGSGLSTPVSQDRDSYQSPFDVGGEDLEKKDHSPVGSFSAEGKSMDGDKVVSEDEGGVEVVQELLDSNKIVTIEHVQSSKGSPDKDGSGSSSSSSDDESREDEKKENEEAGSLVVEEPSLTDLVPKQGNQLIEKATAEEILDLDYKDDTSSSSNHSDDESRVDNMKVTEEACNSVVEEPSSSTELVLEETSQLREEAPVEEGIDTVEPVVSVAEEEIHVKECVSILDSVSSELAVSVLNDEALSNIVKSSPEESEGKLVSSSCDSSDKTGNGIEHTKNSKIPHAEDEHRLPVVAPRPVQTTSWKGCCGLFEVLTGSSR